MFPSKSLFALTGLIAAGLSPILSASAVVEGEFVIHGLDYPAVDAIAWHDDDELRLVFTDKTFDRAAFAEDGKLDSFDFMRGDQTTYTVTLDPASGKVRGISTLSAGISGFRRGVGEDIVLEHHDERRIAGRFSADGGVALTFDLTVTGSQIERPGTPLPADGGEPGKVLLARMAAIHAGDIDELIANTPPDQAEEMHAAVANGEADQLMAMAKMFTPTDIVVTGGRQDGDTAWVDFTGNESGGKVKGFGKLLRHDGRWQVESINTRNVSE